MPALISGLHKITHILDLDILAEVYIHSFIDNSFLVESFFSRE